MPLLVSLADIRDVFIIVYGAIGILFFVVAVAATLGLFFAVKALIRSVNDLINESVKPTLGSVKETVDTVRGTTQFVSQTTVSPIVKTYGTFAGVRRGLGVISGITRRKRGK